MEAKSDRVMYGGGCGQETSKLSSPVRHMVDSKVLTLMGTGFLQENIFCFIWSMVIGCKYDKSLETGVWAKDVI